MTFLEHNLKKYASISTRLYFVFTSDWVFKGFNFNTNVSERKSTKVVEEI